MKKYFLLSVFYIVLTIILSDNSFTKPSNNLPSIIYDHGEMILIPAGEFQMGNPFEGESPVHTVYLDSYYIDKFEVTNGQFDEFITAGGYNNYEYWTDEGWEWKEKKAYSEPKWWLSGQHHSGKKNPDYPVIGVSWHEAYAYARWAGKNLPTECEWEKASKGIKDNIYPWGKEWDPNKCVSMGQDMKIVGSIPYGNSPYGVSDMAGNVWEWCIDWYSSSYYQVSPYKNPQGPEKGIFKVLKGGSYGNSSSNYFRCSFRYKAEVNYWDEYTGFRCVKKVF